MKRLQKIMSSFLSVAALLLLSAIGCAPLYPTVISLPIRDNFSEKYCGWVTGEDDVFSYGCDQGAYRFRIKKALPAMVLKGPVVRSSVVSAEVDATVVSGMGTEPGKARLGIGCIYDEKRGYAAIINTDGSWAIMRFDGSQFIQLAGTDEPGQIPGLGRTNRLRIVCDDKGMFVATNSTISFFVNGNKVGSAESTKPPYGEQYRGFMLWTHTLPGEVAFERFVADRGAE